MNRVVSKKKAMVCWRDLVLLSLLLLMLFQMEPNSCYAEENGKFSSFKVGSSPVKNAVEGHKGFKGNAGKDSDEIFGADKRKVYTGPNPLHNR